MKRTSAGRASLSNPLRVVNGSSVTRGTNRGSKLPTAAGRSSFGGRSSIGSRASVRGSALKKPTTFSFQRPSTGGAPSRRSSAYGRYGHEGFKDPRPINNKAFKDQSIRQLVEFLSANSYPHELSPKMLISPLGREFCSIFEFMFRFFDSTFKMNKKPEDYIPMTFKRLRYPFQISKSSMFSVGSPHTWPTLLAALTWLRDVLKVMSDFDVQKGLFRTGDFGDSNEPQFFFEYVEKTYRQFMKGIDLFEEEEEELANNIRTCGEMADMDQNIAENRTLKEELSFLLDQPDQLLKQKEMYDMLSLDLEKIKGYDSTLDTYNRNKEEKESQLDAELAETESELPAILQDNDRKQQIYESQEFSLDDVERLKMERQNLQGSIDTIETDIKNTEQQVWSDEVAMAKIQENIDHQINQYNQAAGSLRLIPSSAENAGGQDYDLTGKVTRFQREATKFVTIIKPGLLQLRKRMKLLVHQATDVCITEADAVDQMAELVAEKTQAVTLLNTHQKRLDDSIEGGKETFAADQEKLLADIDQLQDCLYELRKRSSHSLEEAQRQMAAAKRQAKMNQAGHQKKELDYMSFLERAIELVITHKGIIQDHATERYKQVKDAYIKDLQRAQLQSLM